MARHRQRWWWRRKPPPPPRPRTVEVVDAGTLLAHLLTLDAYDAGRLAQGRYVALCGAEVLPACLVEPGHGYCRSCVPAPRWGPRGERRGAGPAAGRRVDTGGHHLRTGRDLLGAHRASRCPGGSMVRARCRAAFEPAARFTCGELLAVQALEGRVCAACQARQGAAP